MKMADSGMESCGSSGETPEGGGDGGGEDRRLRGETPAEDGALRGETAGGLNSAQKEVLERCLHALKHTKSDSHTLAALLVITRVCPAKALDKPTLRRVFSAVGLNLPARLLVTALRGSQDSGLAPDELLSLGTALLAALSTDADLSHKPQLLSTIPALLKILSQGINQQRTEDDGPQVGEAVPSPRSHDNSAKSEQKGANVSSENDQSRPEPFSKLDEAMATDCYQVLYSVCSLPLGPQQLLNRGAVGALCRAVERNQTLSVEKGIPLLGFLLSGKTKEKAWSKHPNELFRLLMRITEDFCQALEKYRLEFCGKFVHFLPPAEAPVDGQRLMAVAGQIWGVLRPMLQSKLAPRQVGSVLVLGACLLELCGWEAVGSPRFCCLLVNRACVEVRMGLEEPPGSQISEETQHTLTGCYRIMEAAMEQACTTGSTQAPAQSSTLGSTQAPAQSSTTGTTRAPARSSTQAPAPSSTTGTTQAPAQTSTQAPAQSSSQASAQSSMSGLSLQQSRQVLLVLQEAFSAVIYHLQQVDSSSYGSPFVFASFRSLCSWLAEETSCLREEVTALLPFLIGYCRSHMSGEDTGLCEWMERTSAHGERWTGKEPLRFLLPALCHLSAEDKPRKELLSLDTPELLVSFIQQTWSSEMKRTFQREPGLETACSVLLNFTVTEPQRVRSDPCFRALETLLAEALPVVMNKPELIVLAANFCTLALMMSRLHSDTDSVPSSHSFFSCCVRFLSGALTSSPSGPPSPSPLWRPCWDEAVELWSLSVQALSSCIQTQSWSLPLVRETWLTRTLDVLGQSREPPDADTLSVLQEALCSLALHCPDCREEIRGVLGGEGGGLSGMVDLKQVLSEK